MSIEIKIPVFLLLGLLPYSAFSEDALQFKSASISDFSPVLKAGAWRENLLNTSLGHDFDGDEKNDEVKIEISQSKQKYRVVVNLSSKSDSSPIELWGREIPNKGFDGIWETIWLKAPGEIGISNQKYFNAPGKDYPYLSDYTKEDIEGYKKAVEEYVSMPVIEANASEMPSQDPEDLYFCLQSYYFKDGIFNSLVKCD